MDFLPKCAILGAGRGRCLSCILNLNITPACIVRARSRHQSDGSANASLLT
jgi:hypothetical protein